MPLSFVRFPHCTVVCIFFVFQCGSVIGAASCDISPPSEWSQSQSRWDGGCKNGFASGHGVLKKVNNGVVLEVFYGVVDNGQIKLGVIEKDEGFVAGTFDAGNLLPTEDRSDIVNAFVAASKAASATAEKFKKNGNIPSYRFYKKKSIMLRDQMD